jgi:hypothetical protein
LTLQADLDDFLVEYNTTRPHPRALVLWKNKEKQIA